MNVLAIGMGQLVLTIVVIVGILVIARIMRDKR
ncbi:hypothetical protein FB2170_07354 [Maribacter sp. HTCC2170]|nr:hypothetical protein FB2170_07354 [Maribacter sp. HTCC2170]